MRHAKAWWTAGLLMTGVLGGVAAACSAADSAEGAFSNPTAGGAGVDGGADTVPVGNAGSPATTDVEPTDNAIIVVHAAGFSAFRLCFVNYPGSEPTPTADLMPEANVVGVDVGSAVRLDPLTDDNDGGLPGVPGDIYAFAEEDIRTAAAGVTCGTLLGHAETFALAVKLGNISTPLDHGVHILAVTGCDGNALGTTYTKAECGPDYDGTRNLAIRDLDLTGQVRQPGQLPAEVVNLSTSLDQLRGASAVSIVYGDLGAATGVLPNVTNPPLNQISTPLSPTPELDASDESIYGKVGFTVKLGDVTLAQQSLANIQQLSAPRDVPTTYYATASNYVLLLLGQPPVDASGVDAGLADDVRVRLHLLAVPVVDPKPDGGADGGSDDGGLDAAVVVNP